MKTLSFICAILLVGFHCFAQPDWNVVSYTNSTTAYGTVTINGNPADNGDLVGVFVGDECRAAQNIVLNSGVAYVTLVIQGESVETIEFKVWDADQDQILDVAYTTQTSPGGTIGYPPNYLPIDATSSSNGPPVADAGENQGHDSRT